MYTFDLIFKNNNPKYEDIVHDIYTFTNLLGGCSQILTREYTQCINNNITKVQVICPELNSLDDKNSDQYVKKWKITIEERLQSKIKYKHTGTEPDYPLPHYSVPENKSSFYILRDGWSSPLICGDTDTPIPLYKIPYTNKDNTCYDNIWNWKRHHQSLYRLWLSSQAITEEFVTKQMQDIDSEHNIYGRKLCSIIEEKTGVPTYYFLFNYRSWTRKEDLNRKCPITGEKWKIGDNTSADFIAFKCDESRLVSELSTNCTDEKEN